MDPVSLIKVGQVYLNCWKRYGLDDVVKRHTRETEACRIDDCSVDIIYMRLKGVDQYALVIRLLDDYLDTELGRKGSNLFVDKFKCLQPVNIRLAAPKEI